MAEVFRCGACGHTISESEEHVELIREIKDWINYILRAKHSQGFTASYANAQGVACPACGERRQWLNV